MNFLPHHIYHVYNQGNNQQILFHDAADYSCFLRLTENNLCAYTNIVAYCLMPNHFHFQLATDERCGFLIKQGGLLLDPVTDGFRKLLSSYARIYNKKYLSSGSIFRQKTKSKDLSAEAQRNNNRTQDYHRNCFHYIHQNPWKANLVSKMEDWEYSSFTDYAGIRPGT